MSFDMFSLWVYIKIFLLCLCMELFFLRLVSVNWCCLLIMLEIRGDTTCELIGVNI